MPTVLIDRNKFPPGGWVFRQPETNWTAPTPMASNFLDTVKQIIAHRNLNPGFPYSTVAETVGWELENYTCLRLKNNPQYCHSDEPHAAARIATKNVTPKRRCRSCS